MKKSFDFLGPEVSGADRDRVYVIPVPIEWSTSYQKGTAHAPAAILEASRQVELYNQTLGLDLERSGIATLDPEIGSKEELSSFITRHRPELMSVFPCFIGGEHSITPWILEALRPDRIGIVWLDAHADLRESYLGEKENHACAARNSLPFGQIVEVGVRSYSKEEGAFLAGSDRIVACTYWDARARDAVYALPDRVYLSIDYDVIDPSLLRAVGTPEPDGLQWDTLMDLLTFVFSEKTVIGMDAVELCPKESDEVSNFIAAKVLFEAISRLLSKGG
ncbi:MAG: arginase family protein [bacterium]|nr:MAG: arginase family protein [bacterium]